MKIEFDSASSLKELRAIAAFALMLAGDIAVPTLDAPDDLENASSGDVPSSSSPPPAVRTPGTHLMTGAPFPPAPPAPVTPSVSVPPAAAAPASATIVPFPAPNLNSALMGAPLPALHVPSAAQSTPTIPATSQGAAVEYDKAGLPWDARIHNKGRTKKKDGTWKLTKGLDPNVAQSVVQELIAKKAAGVPQGGVVPYAAPAPALPPTLAELQRQASMPAPLPPTGGPLTPDPTAEARAAFAGAPPPPNPSTPPVSLPPAQLVNYPPPYAGVAPGTLPVSAFTGAVQSVAAHMPLQGVPGPVHVPAPAGVEGASHAAAGAVPAAPPSAYKQLIDKLTLATQNKTLDPRSVAPTVQYYGVPNMGVLGDPQYAHLLAKISYAFDCVIAGQQPPAP